MKFVKLPYGRIINMDMVRQTDFIPTHIDHDTEKPVSAMLLLDFGGKDYDEDDWDLILRGDDAEALAAWLDLNSDDAAGLKSIANSFKE